MSKNIVISGAYEGRSVLELFGDVKIGDIYLNHSTVSSYEVVDEQYRKSAGSAVGRAAVGAFFLGPVGLLAGISAKSKGIHTLIIYFHNGQKSMIEVDDATYKAIVKALF